MSVLKDQIAVVTGANGGIGRAIADVLSRQGVRLVLTGRDATRLSAHAERLGSQSGVVALPCDLENDDAVHELCASIGRICGRVDMLVHCAGTIDRRGVVEAGIGALDRQLRVNTRAPLLLTQGLLPLLKQPRGQVVFVNSSAGLPTRNGVGAYAASKQALRVLADAVRDEVNAQGVRVMSVFPGRTATAMAAAVFADEGRTYDPGMLLQPDDIADIVVHALALPWTAEVTDISIRPFRKV